MKKCMHKIENMPARPPGSAKFATAPPPGLTRQANAPQYPGGWGWAQVEFTDA